MTTRARLVLTAGGLAPADEELASLCAGREVPPLTYGDARKLLALVEAVEVHTLKEARWHRAQMEFVHAPSQRTSVDEHARMQAAANIAQGEAVAAGIALRAALAALTTATDAAP